MVEERRKMRKGRRKGGDGGRRGVTKDGGRRGVTKDVVYLLAGDRGKVFLRGRPNDVENNVDLVQICWAELVDQKYVHIELKVLHTVFSREDWFVREQLCEDAAH